jgi:hypothetical protein
MRRHSPPGDPVLKTFKSLRDPGHIFRCRGVDLKPRPLPSFRLAKLLPCINDGRMPGGARSPLEFEAQFGKK